MYNYIIIDYSCQGLSLQQNKLLDRQASRLCITIIMITQKLDNASELSTGQEVDTIYITDEELESLAQELTKEYGDFIGNNIMGID